MTIREVRRWAREQGILRACFVKAYDDAFLVAVSRLLQAIYREAGAPFSAVRQDTPGRWSLDLGRQPMLRAPVSGPLPFRRLEVTGFPSMIDSRRPRPLRTPRAFLNALRRALRAPEIIHRFEALVADFNNSFANLVLNRLLARRLDARAQALEPAYQGHHYYPFPALRIGPSLAQVIECSHLCRDAIDLKLAAVPRGRFHSEAFDDHRACFRAWAGISPPRGADVVIPLHPWQLELSPIVRELLARRRIAVLDETLKAVPLASQRTCRIVATGFDVKLPVDATLTAEHRLLYPLNRANAPAVAALARILLSASGHSTLDFQYDVAAMAHPEPDVETHLSAIVRSPVRQHEGEIVVPAVNLWSGPQHARALLHLRRPQQAYDFFRAYCRVLMRGPVDFYARWGMAFEPHLQNVHVVLHRGMPSRIILRDLDGTILDPVRIQPIVRANHLRLAAMTWRHMPPFETGGQRLAHAMLFGHLGTVMSYLTSSLRADLRRLAACVEETWSEMITAAPSPSYRRLVCDLRANADTVKTMLRTRLARSTELAFGDTTAGDSFGSYGNVVRP